MKIIYLLLLFYGTCLSQNKQDVAEYLTVNYLKFEDSNSKHNSSLLYNESLDSFEVIKDILSKSDNRHVLSRRSFSKSNISNIKESVSVFDLEGETFYTYVATITLEQPVLSYWTITENGNQTFRTEQETTIYLSPAQMIIKKDNLDILKNIIRILFEGVEIVSEPVRVISGE